MTRVSDRAEFALAVAEGGALPMVAFALLKGNALEKLLDANAAACWASAPGASAFWASRRRRCSTNNWRSPSRFHPDYAIIAGGRPDQAVRLEAADIPAFLHVPSANLIPLVPAGRRAPIHLRRPRMRRTYRAAQQFRALEHDGRSASCAELATGKVPAGEIELLFAGGIHDAASSAMVQVLAAPLVAKGVKVGILMGSAYLFTKEIVRSGADRAAIPTGSDRLRTHGQPRVRVRAMRAAVRITPLRTNFFRQRKRLRERASPRDESAQDLWTT